MNQRTRLVLLLALWLAFALRLHHLGAQSLWYDETVSLTLAREPLGELLAHTSRDIHPPGYYLALAAWLQLLPATPAPEFVSAFFSLVAGMLLLPLTFILGRQWRLPAAVAVGAVLLQALSPFHVWYSQEVRMYTLAAALGLLAAWNLQRGLGIAPSLNVQNRRSSILAWTYYGLAAAAGLYTLYYFAFLLLTINLLAIAAVIAQASGPAPTQGDARRNTHQALTQSLAGLARLPWRPWLLTHLALLLAYAPWLPLAWRQISNPPVPPWRSFIPLPTSLHESLLAVGFGQALPAALASLGLGIMILLLLAAWPGTRTNAPHRTRQSFLTPAPAVVWLLAYTLLPIAMIYLASVLRTPLYHVRYTFTYAPPFTLLLSLGLFNLWRRRGLSILAVLASIGLLVLSLLSLQRAWRDPDFRADDHRAALHYLSSRWRPGDVILVNAGYAYTALLTYWDQPIAWRGRLTDFTPAAAASLIGANGAIILQTGSVDGPASLGWGDPAADFYAMPAASMVSRLQTLAAATPRLWHYRIYDTVTDPTGRVRDALAPWRLFEDVVFSGQANLRVQGFWSRQVAVDRTAARWQVGHWLQVAGVMQTAPALTAGQIISASLALQRVADQPGQALALSLRLLDSAGVTWAQADEPVGGNQRDLRTLAAGEVLPLPLRLVIPPGTPPGAYRLAVIFYDPASGQPLTTDAGAASLPLGDLTIAARAQPTQRPALADFGPLALIAASSPAATISPGDAIPLEILWQAGQAPVRPSPVNLVVVVQLLAADGRVAASLETQPLAGRYPTAKWLAGELVRDRYTLNTPHDLPAGVHRLVVGIQNTDDGQRLRTPCGVLPWATCDIAVIKQVEVRP